jgi:hypothetical protein
MLTSTVHAGLQRQPTTTTQITADTHQAFDEHGDVDVKPLLSLKVRDLVAFKLGDEVVVGTITQRDMSRETGLKIFGTFADHGKSGFLFHFSPINNDQVTIRGVLFFVDKNVMYNLGVDESHHRLYFERQELTPRQAPPPTDTSVTK